MNSELYQYHISAWTPTTARNYIPKMSEKRKQKYQMTLELWRPEKIYKKM